jgi:hypothetical protein
MQQKLQQHLSNLQQAIQANKKQHHAGKWNMDRAPAPNDEMGTMLALQRMLQMPIMAVQI